MDLIRRNLGLKLTALAIAVGLWFAFNYLTATETYSTTLQVPLALRGVSAGLVAQSDVHDVTVELAGPRALLEKLAPSDFAAYVDASGKEAGTLSLNVAVAGPESDKIRSVSPSAAIVVLDRFSYRTVPVIASDSTQSAIASAINPPSVTVAGAESVLARVVAARAGIETASASKPLTIVVKPVAVDVDFAPVLGVTVAPPTVRVSLVPRKGP